MTPDREAAELPPLPTADCDDFYRIANLAGLTFEQAQKMRAYGAEVRRQALEAAAQIAESDEFYGTVTPVAIASAIRALMDKEG